MGIYRVEKSIGDIMVLNRKFLLDHNLSLKAKGLLATMICTKCNLTDMPIFCSSGRDAIRSALKELIEHDYVKVRKIRNEKGQYDSEYSCADGGF